MDPTAASATPTIDTEALGLDEGALLLVRRALAQVPVGGQLHACGRAPNWELHLTVWCRQQGHTVDTRALANGACEAIITRGPWAEGRWRDALATGQSQLATGELPAASAEPAWGLAARGATVEAGSPAFNFTLSNRDELWATTAEARHVEVFTRRLGLRGNKPMLSTAGGQASLRTLLQARDFSSATFLLSVLGEGIFVNLLKLSV